jgi:hypothetical protein
MSSTAILVLEKLFQQQKISTLSMSDNALRLLLLFYHSFVLNTKTPVSISPLLSDT